MYKANLNGIPEKFTLGTGHVKFFYNKGLYTHKRYMELYNECIKRGINVQNYSDAWNVYKEKFIELYNDYTPTPEGIELIKQRIKERNGTY